MASLMLTLKQAKATRCDTHSDSDCKCWHSTCRRCELHGYHTCFNRESQLCDECYKEYRGWYQEEILNPAIKAFDAEKEAGLDPEWGPYDLRQAYAVWMKQAPHRLRAVYTIQNEVVNLEVD